MIKETKDPFLNGDFDSMDMLTRVTVENALLCFTAPNTKHHSVTPKITFESAFSAQQNDLRTFNQAFYPERPEKSLESPPQCLRVINQKWPLVVLVPVVVVYFAVVPKSYRPKGQPRSTS